MKIISGKYKGLKITGEKIIGTRPTMARVRESLFAILTPYLKDAHVLDLFAGTGALGIQALSNGAKSCVFVEKNKKMSKILLNNLINIEEEYKVLAIDFSKINGCYDLIFLDPPYQSNLLEKALQLIKDKQLLTLGGLIICESEKEKMCYNGYEIIKEKKYGRKKIIIITKEVDDGTGTNCGT